MQTEQHFFEDDGTIPNNRRFPVLLYHGVFTNPDAIQATFEANGWGNSWVDGIFDFHHYHSTTHEVLGVKSGQATVLLGGPDGKTFDIAAGDVLVLPAGTGHRRLEASRDFAVVGAYPGGSDYDTLTGESNERPDNVRRIETVKKPATNPVLGVNGPLIDIWKGEEHL
ncbi:hypothetical protein [Exiguobacterium flavidum]|uniref:hypothetical protein n=1 Tax=Exiguobacterium flavidum TaxID=2184695 RepID=UPI000DF73BCE|nr:hypothetical protein [Exiguobacterium flavidum]